VLPDARCQYAGGTEWADNLWALEMKVYRPDPLNLRTGWASDPLLRRGAHALWFLGASGAARTVS